MQLLATTINWPLSLLLLYHKCVIIIFILALKGPLWLVRWFITPLSPQCTPSDPRNCCWSLLWSGIPEGNRRDKRHYNRVTWYLACRCTWWSSRRIAVMISSNAIEALQILSCLCPCPAALLADHHQRDINESNLRRSPIWPSGTKFASLFCPHLPRVLFYCSSCWLGSVLHIDFPRYDTQ